MIDPFTTKISFLIFEAVFCALGAIVYAVSEDHLRLRKAVVLSLNVSCCIMLVCEYLFYVYRGCTDPVDVVVMRVVNAGVYYMILLLMFFYAMLVAVRLFERFDLKADMPCRRRFVSVCILAVVGLVLVTVSQFTGIYYSFDANNVYQPLLDCGADSLGRWNFGGVRRHSAPGEDQPRAAAGASVVHYPAACR